MCGGFGLGRQHTACLTAWADDSQTQEVDGYQVGETMHFRIWQANEDSEYEAQASYSEGDGAFGSGAFSRISSLHATTSVRRTILVQAGWSWISTNVDAGNVSVEDIFSGLSDLVIAINGAGDFYIPNVVNSIGEYNSLEAYKVYLNDVNEFTVGGVPIPASTPITLNAGWNFVSYLPQSTMTTEQAMTSILAQLAIVKNDAGQFMIPGLINTIPEMRPGEGYRLYVDAPATLIYPASGNNAVQRNANSASQSRTPRHFTALAPSGEYASIVVSDISVSGKLPDISDEVGVFTPNGRCAGSAVWNGPGYLAIAAWGDNPHTQPVEGFRVGERLQFRFWDQSASEEMILEAEFVRGAAEFNSAPFVEVRLSGDAVPQEFRLHQNYPNPFNARTAITFELPTKEHVAVRVYNLLGEEVKTLVDQPFAAGQHTVYWDGADAHGTELGSGVYIYRVKSGAFTAAGKAILVK